jgi:hypothetical protein
VLPASAVTPVGVGGGGPPVVVTGADGTDGALAPTAFVAVTRNVYIVESASPLTLALVPVTTTTADGVIGEMSSV